ncbi:M15 family metallopeptidase [Fusobacterium gastrosuis]|uniref:M15 family metallopeptidase n=1 Tax=Fusobacterium gastrosuis TaxID=1755100 RepID=UPI00345AE772
MKNLENIDKRLKILFCEAIKKSPYDFIVTEGLRTKERQEKLFKNGKTKTLNSKHLHGKAVDIAIIKDKKIVWDYSFYKKVAEHIKTIAQKLNLEINWGGDWKDFIDGVHFELKE